MKDPSLCSNPGVCGRGQLPPGGRVKLESSGSQGGLETWREEGVPAGTDSVRPHSRVTLPSAWFPAGMCCSRGASLGRTLERARTPPVPRPMRSVECRGQLSSRLAEGSGGVRWLGCPGLWRPLSWLWAGGQGMAALCLLTPVTGLCTGGSPIPVTHWPNGGIPLPCPLNVEL